MSNSSPLRQFVTVLRKFGFVTATRVAYSKIRGILRPELALPDTPAYSTGHREVSVFLSTADHGAATIDAAINVLARRGGAGWEVCICEHSAAQEAAPALARWRGTQPWIRIVTADDAIDDATARRWTVEQATGEFVLLVAPGYSPEADAIARLLARLRNDPGTNVAVLAGADGGSARSTRRNPPPDYPLLLFRKSAYLASLSDRWLLSAPELARLLDEAGTPIACVAAEELEQLPSGCSNTHRLTKPRLDEF